MGTVRRTIAWVCGLSLAGCTSHMEASLPPAKLPKATAPVLAWRLPKTVLDVTVTYIPVKCEGDKLTVDATVDIAGRAIPDPNLGPNFAHGLVTVDMGDQSNFWVDKSLTYKVYTGGLLQSISSHPTSQAGTIAGNFITGAVKIAAAVMGVAPAPFDPSKHAKQKPVTQCSGVGARLDLLETLRKRIPTEDSKKAADDTAHVVAIKASMTVVAKKTFDPGVDPIGAQGMVGTIKPDVDDVKKAGWYFDSDPALTTTPAEQIVSVYLAFDQGQLLATCGTPAIACTHANTSLPRGTLYRQAAYIPVSAQIGVGTPTAKPLGKPAVFAFGQFGEARMLPLSAKAFQDISWEVDFADTGEVTTTVFSSKATGVAISSMFAGAAGAAATTQQYVSTANAAPDPETAALTKKNAAMQAKVDNAKLKAEVDAIDAGLPVPSSN